MAGIGPTLPAPSRQLTIRPTSFGDHLAAATARDAEETLPSRSRPTMGAGQLSRLLFVGPCRPGNGRVRLNKNR